jgi:hypothetical protein
MAEPCNDRFPDSHLNPEAPILCSGVIRPYFFYRYDDRAYKKVPICRWWCKAHATYRKPMVDMAVYWAFLYDVAQRGNVDRYV